MYLLRKLVMPFAISAPALQSLPFLLLTLSCVLVTLAGYLINDYYDFEGDRLNGKKAKKLALSAHQLLWFYVITLFLSLLAALGAAFSSNHTPWLWLWPLAAFLLWWYARHLKGTVLWGNVLVSLFCAGVPLLVWFAALPLVASEAPLTIQNQVWMYALFAFLSNMLREVVKDGEDMKGDAEVGQVTLAVRFGGKASLKTAKLIYLLLLLTLIWWFLLTSNLALNMGLLVAAVLALPMFLLGWQLTKPLPANWKKMSAYTKLLMLAGLLLLLLPH